MTRVETPGAGRKTPPRSPAMVVESRRILLADDDHDLRDALSVILRRKGYRVETVASGIGLLNRLSGALLDGERAPADVIVTDVRMPGCNGLNLVEGLRDNGWTTPIIVISAFGDEDMRGRVAKLDNTVLLEKPFQDRELDGALRRVLSG